VTTNNNEKKTVQYGRACGLEVVMNTKTLYEERLSSPRTEALFVALTLLFLSLSAWRVTARGLDGWGILLFCLFAVFLFYALNYRTLVIHLTGQSLRLTFGIFTWIVPLDNIEGCRLDDSPALARYGGAGIHFMTIGQRYRASFNFLEYPRLVIRLKVKKGLVRDIAFSTRRPDEMMKLLQEVTAPERFARAAAIGQQIQGGHK
jgi:hypothetical protein